MKDIPVFDTENGVGSLFLREIPYRGRAHIKIHSSLEPEKFLEECISFCRMCGAQWCDASGHDYLEKYPLLTTLIRMQVAKASLPETDACLFPVTEKNVAEYIRIYNQRMADVPNCMWMDSNDAKQILADGDSYFIHRNKTLLGIGQASGNTLHTVIATQPGMGETVVAALASILQTETISLQVAATNQSAVKLYRRMGFLPIAELSRWYRVLG